MRTDWMPGKRDDQLALAKLWVRELPLDKGVWLIPPSEIIELGELVAHDGL